MTLIRSALALGLWSVLLCTPRVHAATKEVRRVAVIVGANAATTGRAPLRFAHADARNLASVLTELGRFAVDDVHLLFDPRPAEVLAAIDAAKATLARTPGESLLVFYYSGHADDHSLYPGGQPLTFDALRGRLDASSASVRLGIIDTCRGGGWTRAKGLVAGEPFEVNDPLTLEAQGSVLIASSSGLENAHETEALQGSFFTHHLVAGLRGAADQSDDGEVTLVEAFSYARALTVRDTAVATDAPQHPSFRFNLSGQKDLPLTRVKTSESQLTVVQLHGPLRVIHLPSGNVVAELPPGPRSVTLAVSPGRYVVSTAPFGAVRAHRELTVGLGVPARVTESELDETRPSPSGSKYFNGPATTTLSSMPRGGVEVVVAAGVVHTEIASNRDDKPFDPYSQTPTEAASSGIGSGTEPIRTARPGLQVRAAIGLTDRLMLSLPLPGLTYRLGLAGDREWLVWAGAFSVQLTSTDFTYLVGGGVDLRQWVRSNQSFGVGLRTKSGGEKRFDGAGQLTPLTWIAELGAVYSLDLGEAVTFNLGVAMAVNVLTAGHWSQGSEFELAVGIGSILERGMRPLPVVQVHLSQRWSLDLYVTVRRKLGSGDLFDAYMVGLSWAE